MTTATTAVTTAAYPLDVLARLAVAAGYNARGDRVQAEHHLGMALGMLSRGDNRQVVTLAEAEELLRAIEAIARGPLKTDPAPRVIEAPRCRGRIVGAHGVINRCARPAEDGETMCARCAAIRPPI